MSLIRDLHVIQSSTAIDADLCIVGGGIAGLTLAREFANTQWSVVVLEAGGESHDPASQSLFDAEVSGSPYRGHIEGRFRVFGGSSIKWGGALLPLSPHDFLLRPYVHHSGWPIAFEELAPFYGRAERAFRVDSLPYDQALRKSMRFAATQFDGSLFQIRYSKWSRFEHRNFAATLGAECKKAANITALLNATAVKVGLRLGGTSVDRIHARSLSGRTAVVRAKHYVLCCGTLETTRLLLVSNNVAPGGVGNDAGLVGKFFQDHVSYRAAELEPVRPDELAEGFMARFRRRIMRYPRLEFTPATQDRLQCLSAFGQLLIEAPQRSGFALVRDFLRGRQSGQAGSLTLCDIATFVADMPYVAKLGKAYVAGGRLPIPPRARWVLQVDVEQEPSPESAVSLTEQRDPLGMPKLRIHWQIGERERHSVRQFISLFRQEWERLRFGYAKWNPSIELEGMAWLADSRDAFHQAGTTRMSDDRRTSVVDRDLRVHGIHNLHVASCSVFPTSGSANPTFTLVALCLRLGDRLRTLLDRDASGPIS